MKRDYIAEVIAEDAALRNPLTYPRPYAGCPHLQASKDKKLRAALAADLGADIADRAMKIVQGQR